MYSHFLHYVIFALIYNTVIAKTKLTSTEKRKIATSTYFLKKKTKTNKKSKRRVWCKINFRLCVTSLMLAICQHVYMISMRYFLPQFTRSEKNDLAFIIVFTY